MFLFIIVLSWFASSCCYFENMSWPSYELRQKGAFYSPCFQKCQKLVLMLVCLFCFFSSVLLWKHCFYCGFRAMSNSKSCWKRGPFLMVRFWPKLMVRFWPKLGSKEKVVLGQNLSINLFTFGGKKTFYPTCLVKNLKNGPEPNHQKGKNWART